MKTAKKVSKTAPKNKVKIKKSDAASKEKNIKKGKSAVSLQRSVKKAQPLSTTSKSKSERRDHELSPAEYKKFRRQTAAKEHVAEFELVTVDRRTEMPKTASSKPIEKRAKVARRRQIDPTTCERDYSTEEIEFMGALDEYKRQSGRMFPTCSEILEVFKGLGYIKQSHEEETEIAFDSLTGEATVTSSEIGRVSRPVTYTPPFE